MNFKLFIMIDIGFILKYYIIRKIRRFDGGIIIRFTDCRLLSAEEV